MKKKIKLTDQEREWILSHIENSQQLIDAGNLAELQAEIDSWMATYGYTDDYEPTDELRRVEKMYDHIYFEN